jgi:hypothetical protein
LSAFKEFLLAKESVARIGSTISIYYISCKFRGL